MKTPPFATVWDECRAVAETESVDEALQIFSHDSTLDNATCLVKAIKAELATSPSTVDAQPVATVTELGRHMSVVLNERGKSVLRHGSSLYASPALEDVLEIYRSALGGLEAASNDHQRAAAALFAVLKTVHDADTKAIGEMKELGYDVANWPPESLAIIKFVGEALEQYKAYAVADPYDHRTAECATCQASRDEDYKPEELGDPDSELTRFKDCTYCEGTGEVFRVEEVSGVGAMEKCLDCGGTGAGEALLPCSGAGCSARGEANGKDGLFYCGSGVSGCVR